MLEIIDYNSDKYDFPALVVLGCFDALHVGHAELLKKAKLQAKINGLDLGVMMFAEGKGGRQVFTFEERLQMLAPYNTKFVLKINYTDEFKATAPLDFIGVLEEYINVKGYMSGKDFRFGARAKGKSSTLKNYADNEDNAVWYMPVKDLIIDGEKVSTTLIKKYLEEGKIRQANKLLGREYFITGTVCRGHGRGASELGFPTANIEYPENKVLVAEGVYGVEVIADGETYQGVANFGGRPTFGEQSPVLEAYLDGFSGDLYGKTVTLKFLNCIRSTVAFEDKEALSAQISDDLGKIGLPDADPMAAAPVQEVAEPAADMQACISCNSDAATAEEKFAAENSFANEEPGYTAVTTYETEEGTIGHAEEISTVYDECAKEDDGFGSAAPLEYGTEAEEDNKESFAYENGGDSAKEEISVPCADDESDVESEDVETSEEYPDEAQTQYYGDDGEDFSKELANVDDEIAAIENELYGISTAAKESLYGGRDSDDDMTENELYGSADESPAEESLYGGRGSDDDMTENELDGSADESLAEESLYGGSDSDDDMTENELDDSADESILSDGADEEKND